jgi:hypothetical protein
MFGSPGEVICGAGGRRPTFPGPPPVPPPARKTAWETSTPGPDLACAPAASWPPRWRPPPPTRTNSRRAAVSAAAASPTGRVDAAAGSSPPPPDGGNTGAAQSAGAPPLHPRRRGRRRPRVHGSWAGGRPVTSDGRKEGERRGARRGSRGGMWWWRGGGWGLLGTPLPGPGSGPAFVSAHSCRTRDKLFIFLLQYIHSYNHSLITFAEALFHIFTAAGSVGGISLGCQDSNSGLPYSKPAYYHLSYAAPKFELRYTQRQTTCRSWSI